MKQEINGIILVNKPRGISSNTVVNIVKKAVNAQKAGHLGTLDVAGEGLLPVTLGKGTKLFDFYLKKDKVYKTVFKFGQTTDTLDLEGQITDSDNKVITIGQIQAVLGKFIGKMAQMPPQYSAKKINGQKAYDLARKGEVADLKPKEIEIYNIRLLKQVEDNIFELLVHCSSGTYIRSLVRDIATELSTFGVMLSIQRTKCGEFELEGSFTLEEIKGGKYNIIKLDSLFEFEEIHFTDTETEKVLNGVWINTNKPNGRYKGYGKGEFLGLIEISKGIAKFNLRLI